MTYLLDTSACIALLRNRPPTVRERARIAVNQKQRLLVSSIALHELWYGVYKSVRIEQNMVALQKLLAVNMEIIGFDAEDARFAGELRADLELKGTMIGAFDTLIAAQCLRHNFTLVTADVSDLRRVKDLRWQDWGK